MDHFFERRSLRALLCLPPTRARGQRSATPSQLREALCDKEEQATDVCQVCGDHRQSVGDQILYCEGCNVCVHQHCYGVAGIPNGDWVCRPCEALVPIRERRCDLCPETRGALKRTTAVEPSASSRWAHLVCALHNPNSVIVDTARMEPIVLGAFDSLRANLKCEVCAQRGGAPTQCASRGCRIAMHASCAIEARFLFRWHIEEPSAKKQRATESDSDETVALHILCARHSRADAVAEQEAAEQPPKKGSSATKAKMKAKMKATATSPTAKKARTKRERDARTRKRGRRR